MKLFWAVLGLVTLAAAAPGVTKLEVRNLYKTPLKKIDSKLTPRIIGGREATPHSFPYQAFLEVYSGSSGLYCGGTLISQNYVVTAAHCGEDVIMTYVTLGAHRPAETEDTQIKYTSTDFMLHEDYDSVTLDNDIAVVRLPETVALNRYIQPIGIATDPYNDYNGALATASGWGLTDGHSTIISPVLNYVQMKVISNEECDQYFSDVPANGLCTSGEDNTAICGGDAGGPLVTDGVLIGITSFGGQYCEGYPSGFTRVTSFADWLADNTDI